MKYCAMCGRCIKRNDGKGFCCDQTFCVGPVDSLTACFLMQGKPPENYDAGCWGKHLASHQEVTA